MLAIAALPRSIVFKQRGRVIRRGNRGNLAGLGVMAGKVWRGGLMGHASNTRNILICLGALDDVPVQFHPYDLFIDLAAIAASCASLVA